MTSELNLDAAGLLNVLGQIGRTDRVNQSSQRLSDAELESQFRNSALIQKIIKKYPIEARNIGYQLIESNGNILEENNPILLEAFKDASIYARLYSRCYLYLDVSGGDTAPIKSGSELLGYKIYFDLHKTGDFYEQGTTKIHFHRILEFIGVKTYSKNKDNDADSVIQGLYKSLEDWISCNENGKYILNNLSYLTLGVDNLGNMTKTNEGRGMIFDRLTTLNINRDISRSIAYDKKSETIGFISQSISGIKDIISEAKEVFMSETGYPVEEIFEQSPTQKLGSGIQNQLISRYLWARRCRGWILNEWMPNYITYFNRMKNMLKVSITIPFILDLTDEEKAEIENKGADRIKKLIEVGVITSSEGRSGYRGKQYSLNIALENDDDEIQTSSLTESKKPITQDSELIPNDKFWDALSDLNTDDLSIMAEELLTPNA